MHGWKILSSLSLLMLAYPVTPCLSLWKGSRIEKKDLQCTSSCMRGFMKSCHFLERKFMDSMPDLLWLDTYFTHRSTSRRTFFLLTSLIPTWVQRSNIFLLYQYMYSKTGPSFKNYFWYFFTDSMLGSQTARPISSLFIEYNKHCAIT